MDKQEGIISDNDKKLRRITQIGKDKIMKSVFLFPNSKNIENLIIQSKGGKPAYSSLFLGSMILGIGLIHNLNQNPDSLAPLTFSNYLGYGFISSFFISSGTLLFLRLLHFTGQLLGKKRSSLRLTGGASTFIVPLQFILGFSLLLSAPIVLIWFCLGYLILLIVQFSKSFYQFSFIKAVALVSLASIFSSVPLYVLAIFYLNVFSF